MIDHGVTAGDRFSHLTSVQYQMAVAALDPDRAYDLSPAGPLPPALQAFMSRIQVRAEEGLLTAGDPEESYPKIWPAHVTVTATARRERTIASRSGRPRAAVSQSDALGQHREEISNRCRTVLAGYGQQ